MENDIIEIANEMLANEKAEAQAIIDYGITIKRIIESSLDNDIKKILIDTLEEIIADELNHQKKLNELYVNLTEIQPKGD